MLLLDQPLLETTLQNIQSTIFEPQNLGQAIQSSKFVTNKNYK